MEVNDIIILDDDVLALVKANKKVQAIKLLRQKEHLLGLAEAHQRIDDFLAQNPSLVIEQSAAASDSGSNSGPLIAAAAVVVLVVLYMAGIIG